MARRALQVDYWRCCQRSGPLASVADPGRGSAADSQWTWSCCPKSSDLERTLALMGPAEEWRR